MGGQQNKLGICLSVHTYIHTYIHTYSWRHGGGLRGIRYVPSQAHPLREADLDGLKRCTEKLPDKLILKVGAYAYTYTYTFLLGDDHIPLHDPDTYQELNSLSLHSIAR